MSHSNDSRISQLKRRVEIATRSKNPLDIVLNRLEYKPTRPNGIQYDFYCRQKCDMDSKYLKWAFKLAERNVGPFYKQLSMGWQPKIKQNDLNKAWARYLVAFNDNKVPMAYAMFRFDMDYGYSVLYCYELQIEPEVQRQGLGKFMMYALEECARLWCMEKVVLTVLKNNEKARTFFQVIGFTLDHTTPDVTENAEYEILSKRIS